MLTNFIDEELEAQKVKIICLMFQSLKNYLNFVNLLRVISHDVQRLSSLTYVTFDEL